jgi:hypothetical protein
MPDASMRKFCDVGADVEVNSIATFSVFVLIPRQKGGFGG